MSDVILELSMKGNRQQTNQRFQHDDGSLCVDVTLYFKGRKLMLVFIFTCGPLIVCAQRLVSSCWAVDQMVLR